jgi:hypothetical protein
MNMKRASIPSLPSQPMRWICVLASLWLVVWQTNSAFAQKSFISLPFRINVAFTGSYDDTIRSTDTAVHPKHDTIASKVSHSFVIDSSANGMALAMTGDSLIYFDSIFTFSPYGWTVTHANIHFDTAQKVITSMSLAYSEHHDDEFQLNTTHWEDWGLTCLNIPYYEDSIRSFDSLISSGNLDFYDDTSVFHENDVPPFHGYTWESRFLGGRVSLSGSYAPKSSVSTLFPPPHFSANIAGGQLECSFAPSSQERILSVYSTLGQEIQQISVGPGQNSTAVARLAPGLYFLRLENAVIRIYTPD